MLFLNIVKEKMFTERATIKSWIRRWEPSVLIYSYLMFLGAEVVCAEQLLEYLGDLILSLRYTEVSSGVYIFKNYSPDV